MKTILYRFLALSLALAAGVWAQGLTIGTGSVLSLGGATLSLPNHYTDSGTFVSDSGIVVFTGAGNNQRIKCAAIDNFYDLAVIKAGGNVVLDNDIRVERYLTVMSGDLDMNGDTISLVRTAIVSETQGNTVKGAGRIRGAIRMLGSSSQVNSLGLGAVLTEVKAYGVTIIGRGHVQQNLGTLVSILRFYDLYPAVDTGLGTTLEFHYDTSELNGIQPAMLSLFCSYDTGTTWTKMGGVVDTAARTVTLSGITRLSRWTLGNGGTTAVLAPPQEEQPSASLAAAGVPRVFAFQNNLPNPFSRTTKIGFTLKDDGRVTLKVFDMHGREVTTLVNGVLKAGVMHSASFDASELASGTYLCRLNAGNRSLLRKIKLVK